MANTIDQAGDILFYRAVGGDLPEEIIEHWTGGPFVHAAIVVAPGIKIEAVMYGVVKRPYDPAGVGAVYRYQQQARVDQTRLADALSWLAGQVGEVYGWGDIANAVLEKFEHSFTLDVGGHHDCSALAADFLMRAGGVPGLDIDDPHQINPSQLAKMLGVLS